jgi:hypothetical protein
LAGGIDSQQSYTYSKSYDSPEVDSKAMPGLKLDWVGWASNPSSVQRAFGVARIRTLK